MANTKETPKDPWSEKVSILIPRMPGVKEQPDVIASVNGRVFQIQRGVKVDVPAPIAEVVQRSIDAEMKAEDYYYSRSNA